MESEQEPFKEDSSLLTTLHRFYVCLAGCTDMGFVVGVSFIRLVIVCLHHQGQAKGGLRLGDGACAEMGITRLAKGNSSLRYKLTNDA